MLFKKPKATHGSLLLQSFTVCLEKRYCYGASWASTVKEERVCHFGRFDSLSVSIPVFVNLETSSAIAFIGGQNTPGQKSTAIISDLILM